MIYNVTNDFTAVSVTSGTIQNNSYVYPIEVSDKAEVDSGYLLYPLNKMSFSGTKLYMRCVDGGAWAEIRVVPFVIDGGGSASSVETPTTDSTNIVDDAWNGNIVTDPDSDALIDEMWNTAPASTGDGFDDYLDNLFP